jgi:hypothetical protein
MTEFGHTGIIGTDICIDIWGTGPFVIVVNGKSYRFEDSDRFGPALVNRRGDPLANPWPSERSPFWRAHRIWLRQGRRLKDEINCIWDEPRPSVVRHLGGRNYMHVEAGDEDGVTFVRTDNGDVPLADYVKSLKQSNIS